MWTNGQAAAGVEIIPDMHIYTREASIFLRFLGVIRGVLRFVSFGLNP
jgi:hypothetical protein